MGVWHVQHAMMLYRLFVMQLRTIHQPNRTYTVVKQDNTNGYGFQM